MSTENKKMIESCIWILLNVWIFTWLVKDIHLHQVWWGLPSLFTLFIFVITGVFLICGRKG